MFAEGSKEIAENGQDFEDSEEETLSLCDLPISGGGSEEHSKDRSTSGSDRELEFFEFFNDLNTEMSAAEDIFFRGQILPLKVSVTDRIARNETEKQDFVTRSYLHLRSESSDDSRYGSYSHSCDSRSSRSSSTGRLRNGSWFDSRKLQRTPSSEPRDSGRKREGNYDFLTRRPSQARPKWHNFMFGLMKLPEMEMENIRNRQRRRNPEYSNREYNGRQTVSVNYNRGESRSSWKLLRALSCKGHANINLGCIPHV